MPGLCRGCAGCAGRRSGGGDRGRIGSGEAGSRNRTLDRGEVLRPTWIGVRQPPNSQTSRRTSATWRSDDEMKMNRRGPSSDSYVGPERRASDAEAAIATFWRLMRAVPHLIGLRAVMAVITMVLALPAVSATAPEAPTSDFEYDDPCDDSSGPSYGGEAGARVGAVGAGLSACATNPNPCPNGVAGAVGSTYGHCSR